VRSVPTLHKESIVSCEFASWSPDSSARELQRKGASQREQEPLHTETEDTTLLAPATKQRLIKTVTWNTSLCVIVICKV
jgi:hypothetical protein